MHLKTPSRRVGEELRQSFVAREDRIIGTLPIGYADGYTRMLNGLARVFISGQLVPVIRRVCMDQCMIDLTDVEAVSLYDEVELLATTFQPMC